MEWPKITLFGDSITRRSTDPDNACWGSMLTYAVNNYFDVDTRGFSGYNTEWALELMPKLFPRSYLAKVELFVEFFGHNDSWETYTPQQVRPQQFEKNLRSMVEYLTSNGLDKSKIVLITPGWYHEGDWAQYRAETRSPMVSKTFGHAKKYSDAVVKVASDYGVDVVDFFTVTAQHQPPEALFCDGLHLSRLGAKVLFEALMPVIRRKIEASFEKPLADLWHAIPYDRRPDMEAAVEEYAKTLIAHESGAAE